MNEDESFQEPPRKRHKTGKTSGPSASAGRLIKAPSSTDRIQSQGPDHNRRAKSQQQGPSKHSQSNGAQLFSQPSVINVGDKGIFVTADKGHEKKSLVELNDLVHQFLEDEGIDVMGKRTDEASARTHLETLGQDEANIEADIVSELASLKGHASQSQPISSTSSIRLITLDVPCVSFLRLPPASKVNPTHLVHKLCADASINPSRQKSRHIRRLTPISSLGKALGKGLESICHEVLPTHFGPDAAGNIRSTKFAIRPTTRNNDKLDRDTIITYVATQIGELGVGKHKVDLKHYEKGVLVEVYRGWVGIAVVDNTNEQYRAGFEELKRFNLAEIYASIHKKVSEDKQ